MTLSMITADSPSALLATLSRIDITVPPRTEGRTTQDCERWSGVRFLASLSNTSLLTYPLELVHRDRPDFELRFSQGSVGIEVTAATHPDAAAINALREHRGYEGVFLLSHHKPSSKPKASAELDQIARGEKVHTGWMGNSAEKEWAEAMSLVAQKKVTNAVKPGYQNFGTNWLCIYDNLNLPIIQMKTAMKYLKERLSCLQGPPLFNRIFVEHGDRFWECSGEHQKTYSIPLIWKKRG